MTKEQASKRFGVPLAKLQMYETQGFSTATSSRMAASITLKN